MNRIKKNKTNLLAYPFVIWSTIFIVVPLLIVLFFSFTVKSPSGDYALSFENFNKLLNTEYMKVFKRSLWLALLSTIWCLILGYPVAYFISKMKPSKGSIMIMLFIVPMWMNFLLRTYAWMPILEKTDL